MIGRRPLIAVRDKTSYVIVPTLPSLTLSPSSGNVTVSGTFAITLTLLDGLGVPINAQVVPLTSSNPSAATVPTSVTTNSSGQATFNVTGVAAGTANITAAVLGVTSLAVAMTVAGAGLNLTLRNSKPSFALPVGATLALNVATADISLSPLSGGAPAVTWTSSNTGIATVNSSTGVVTGVAAGAVTITATSTAGAISILGQILSGTYALRDRFIRANSTTSVGVSETGQAWAAQGTAVAGIFSNRVYFPTALSDEPVIADSTQSDGLFTFQFSTPGKTFSHYLRYTDSNNYLKIFTASSSISGTAISLNGKSGGATIGLFTWTAPVRPDDLLVVRLSGNNIQVQLNNDIIGSISSAGYGALTGTNIGVGFQGGTTGSAFARFGEVAARALDHAVSTTVASMVIDQSSATVAADGLLLLRAFQLLSTGENLSLGRNSSNSGPLVAAITWSSSDNTKATVGSTSGVVRGVAAGACTITATDGTHSATCTLTVAAAAGFATTLTYDNEPTGFTQHADRDFSVFAPAGSPDAWLAGNEHATSNMTIATDVTAPKSPSGVLQLQYPAIPSTQPVSPGTTYTAGTLELDLSTPHLTAAYLCRWVKLDPNFQGHSTGANKTGEFFLNNGAAGFAHLLTGAACHSTADPVYPGVCLNGGTDYREGIYFQPNLVPDGTQTRGSWDKIECLFRINTIAVDGTPNFDGEFHVWLNGRKVTELTNLKMADVTGGVITQWKPSYLWGGEGGTIVSTFFLWEDHEHVSVGT